MVPLLNLREVADEAKLRDRGDFGDEYGSGVTIERGGEFVEGAGV